MLIYKAQTNEDIEKVRKIAFATWPSTFEKILSPDQIQYMLDWMYNTDKLKKILESKNEELFILENENKEALGFLAVENNYPSPNDLRIHKLYVLPNMHGLGLGKRLIEFASNLASEKVLNQLHLNVNRFNDSTNFYKHLGFEIIQEEDIDIGAGFWMNDYVMVKKVSL